MKSDQREVDFAAGQGGQPIAIGERGGSLDRLEQFLDFGDGLSVHRSCVGAGVGHGHGGRRKDGNLPIGGQQVEIAALNITEQDPDGLECARG